MSKKLIIQIIVIVLVFVNTLVLGILWWKQSNVKEQLPAGPPNNYIVKELSLSKEQVAQFEELRKEHFTAMQVIRTETRALKEALFENVSTPDVDSNAVNILLTQIGKMEMDKERLTLLHFRKVRTILTPFQQEKFDSIINNVIRMMGRPAGQGMRERPVEGRPPGPRGERPGMRGGDHPKLPEDFEPRQ